MDPTKPQLACSALVTIDTQCDFSLPGAAVEIKGTMDVIPNMRRLLAAYRRHDRPVIHIVRLYLPDGTNADLCRREAVVRGTRIVVPGSEGAELVSALKPYPEARLDADLLLKGRIQEWRPREVVMFKPRWGGFYRTPLDKYLHHLGVDTLVICGCNFPNCPRTTIYEASERDYKVVLAADAVSGLYDRGKEELRNIGVRVWATEKVVEELERELQH